MNPRESSSTILSSSLSSTQLLAHANLLRLRIWLSRVLSYQTVSLGLGHERDFCSLSHESGNSMETMPGLLDLWSLVATAVPGVGLHGTL